jgi:CheY-like chemotaxis protein
VVVLDYSMPGMNGIDLLNVLRNDPRTRRLPVLMLSARDRDLQSVHSPPWLRKPVEPWRLIAELRRLASDDIVGGVSSPPVRELFDCD